MLKHKSHSNQAAHYKRYKAQKKCSCAFVLFSCFGSFCAVRLAYIRALCSWLCSQRFVLVFELFSPLLFQFQFVAKLVALCLVIKARFWVNRSRPNDCISKLDALNYGYRIAILVNGVVRLEGYLNRIIELGPKIWVFALDFLIVPCSRTRCEYGD